MSRIFARRGADTPAAPLSARDTVETATPARAAISAMPTGPLASSSMPVSLSIAATSLTRRAPPGELVHMTSSPAPPPLQPLEAAGLLREAAAFYAENRRVSNMKARRLLGWQPAYPDFATGLRALSAIANPARASAPPPAAIAVQR